jgi:hypothetical protein
MTGEGGRDKSRPDAGCALTFPDAKRGGFETRPYEIVRFYGIAFFINSYFFTLAILIL